MKHFAIVNSFALLRTITSFVTSVNQAAPEIWALSGMVSKPGTEPETTRACSPDRNEVTTLTSCVSRWEEEKSKQLELFCKIFNQGEFKAEEQESALAELNDQVEGRGYNQVIRRVSGCKRDFHALMLNISSQVHLSIFCKTESLHYINLRFKLSNSI